MKNLPLPGTADFDIDHFKIILSEVTAVEPAEILISDPLLQLRRKSK